MASGVSLYTTAIRRLASMPSSARTRSAPRADEPLVITSSTRTAGDAGAPSIRRARP